MRKGFVLALMCAERDPMNCHRAILICRSLRNAGTDIRHIIDHSSVKTQVDLEKRLIAQLKLHPDMFKDKEPSALIERAYDLQGGLIAYVEKQEPGQKTKILDKNPFL